VRHISCILETSSASHFLYLGNFQCVTFSVSWKFPLCHFFFISDISNTSYGLFRRIVLAYLELSAELLVKCSRREKGSFDKVVICREVSYERAHCARGGQTFQHETSSERPKLFDAPEQKHICFKQTKTVFIVEFYKVS
jgi:hypothetical protein